MNEGDPNNKNMNGTFGAQNINGQFGNQFYKPHSNGIMAPGSYNFNNGSYDGDMSNGYPMQSPYAQNMSVEMYSRAPDVTANNFGERQNQTQYESQSHGQRFNGNMNLAMPNFGDRGYNSSISINPAPNQFYAQQIPTMNRTAPNYANNGYSPRINYRNPYASQAYSNFEKGSGNTSMINGQATSQIQAQAPIIPISTPQTVPDITIGGNSASMSKRQAINAPPARVTGPSRRQKTILAKPVADELLCQYGKKAYKLSIKEIIRYMCQGQPPPADDVEPERRSARGTTAHRVKKELERLEDLEIRTVKGNGIPVARAPKVVSGGQSYESNTTVEKSSDSEQQMDFGGQEGARKITAVEFQIGTDVSQDDTSKDSLSRTNREVVVESNSGQSELQPVDGRVEQQTASNSVGHNDHCAKITSSSNLQEGESESSSMDEVDKKASENGDVDVNVDNFEAQLFEVSNTRAGIGAVQEYDNISLLEKLAFKDEELKQIRNSSAILGNNIKQFQDNIEALSSDLKQAHENNSILSDELKQAQDNTADLQEDVFKADAKILSLEDQNNTAENELRATIDEKNEVELTCATHVESIATLRGHVEDFKKNLHQCQEHLRNSRAEAESLLPLQEELSDAQNRVSELNLLVESTKSSHKVKVQDLKLELQAFQAEVEYLTPLKGELEEGQKKIFDLESLVKSNESKHVSQVQDLKNELKTVNRNFSLMSKRMDELERAKKNEEEARENFPTPKVSSFWSSKFVSSKRFQVPGLTILLLVMLYFALSKFGSASNRAVNFVEQTNISTIVTEYPFVYVIPSPSAIEEPTPVGIIAEEATCVTESEYPDGLNTVNLDLNGIPTARDHGRDGSAESEEIPRSKPWTRGQKVFLRAIPVAVLVTGAWYMGWI
ncbi:uncharacterized protein RAG0_06278 [Rhynchosporium agropyri]|uniref:Uncharacterized protein n=1 Tax=Rhynchosporium agropyri TaxID=914238 RepID=A0A1E1KGK4_9HELO|nr:uncharacterized protein RAG0_06278 [Rhynchosporium agropyri]